MSATSIQKNVRAQSKEGMEALAKLSTLFQTAANRLRADLAGDEKIVADEPLLRQAEQLLARHYVAIMLQIVEATSGKVVQEVSGRGYDPSYLPAVHDSDAQFDEAAVFSLPDVKEALNGQSS